MANGIHVGHGRLVAQALAGAWRSTPPPITLTERDLVAIAPMVLPSGAGPLLWWRLRGSSLQYAPGLKQLEEAYRLQFLSMAVYEHYLSHVIRALREVGIDPVVFKGWAVSKLYPDPTVRPAGDIDLVVPPASIQSARQRVQLLEAPRCPTIDIQDERNSALWQMDLQRVCDRAETTILGDMHVKVLAPEDQLAALCVHFLSHGAWRPIGLCDIAGAMERVTADFDWDRCLGRLEPRRGWILCTLGLAGELLDAKRVSPGEGGSYRMPRWLVPTVLKQWDTPYPPLTVGDNGFPAPFASYLRRPAQIVPALLLRWPNPITATIRLAAPMNGAPRLPLQLAYSLLRTKQSLTRGSNPA